MTTDPVLDIKNLSVSIDIDAKQYKAVEDVTLSIGKGEVFGLVGESGCGKSLTALSIAGLLSSPLKICSGTIEFEGQLIERLKTRSMRRLRGDRIAMIFQEPMTALNPLMTVGDQIGEMFVLHQGMSMRDARKKAVEALVQVQVPSPERRIHNYPHQLSGGMRQRIMIAIALSCSPALLIADEPTTALDVTIQAEIVELILELCKARGTAVLMISHDLGLVARMCQRVAVMYAGKIVEEQIGNNIFTDPHHPYAKGLVGSLPRLGGRVEKGQVRLNEISGTVPSIFEFEEGCRFHPRCPDTIEKCRHQSPVKTSIDPRGYVRCYNYG